MNKYFLLTEQIYEQYETKSYNAGGNRFQTNVLRSENSSNRNHTTQLLNRMGTGLETNEK